MRQVRRPGQLLCRWLLEHRRHRRLQVAGPLARRQLPCTRQQSKGSAGGRWGCWLLRRRGRSCPQLRDLRRQAGHLRLSCRQLKKRGRFSAKNPHVQLSELPQGSSLASSAHGPCSPVELVFLRPCRQQRPELYHASS